MAEVVTPRIRIGNQQPVKVRLRVLPSQAPMQIELRNTGTMIQWRYLGRDWQDLITIDSINASVTVGAVETLPAGTPAYVVNVGTPQDVVLNFGIPKGPIESVNGDPGPAVVLDAGDIAVTPVGSIGSTTVQAALAELDAEKQPLDGDLTAIAALSTMAYGRSLLTLAGASGLAAEVDAFFLTPSEGNAAYQPLDGDLTAIAALTTATYGRSLLTLASSTALAAEVDAFFLTPAEGAAAYQPLDGDLTAIAALSTQTFGRARLTDAAAEDARLNLVAPTWVSTRAALKALDTTKDQTAIFDGNIWRWTAGNFSTHVAADTQEAIYVKATAIAASSGAWLRKYSGALDFRWFQPVGDGSTNDAVPLQKALDLIAFLGGGELSVPPAAGGTFYSIASNISIDPQVYFAIIGVGYPQFRFTQAGNCFSIGNTTTLRQVRVRLEKLMLWGSGSNGNGLRVNHIANFRMIDCSIYNHGGIGCFVSDTYTSFFETTEFTGCGLTGCYVITAAGNATQFMHCKFIGNDTAGEAGLFIDGSAGLHYGTVIQGCDFESNTDGLKINGVHALTIDGNYFEFQLGWAINIQGSVDSKGVSIGVTCSSPTA